jgi:Rrf2 family protein
LIKLEQAGYIETVRGRNGGLRLGKVPSEIVVVEVVRTIEPDFAVVECQNSAGYCKIVSCCTLRSASEKLRRLSLNNSDEYTLVVLIRPKSKLRHLLGLDS